MAQHATDGGSHRGPSDGAAVTPDQSGQPELPKSTSLTSRTRPTRPTSPAARSWAVSRRTSTSCTPGWTAPRRTKADLDAIRRVGPIGTPQNRSERDAFATLHEDRLAQLEAVEDRLASAGST